MVFDLPCRAIWDELSITNSTDFVGTTQFGGSLRFMAAVHESWWVTLKQPFTHDLFSEFKLYAAGDPRAREPNGAPTPGLPILDSVNHDVEANAVE